MLIVWDEPKRLTNLKEHQLDFRMLEGSAFFESAVIVAGKGDRFVALGRIDRRPYAAVFKPLGVEAVSVISFRIASKEERRLV